MSNKFRRAGAGVVCLLSAAAFGQGWPCVEGWQGPSIPGVAGQLNTYSVKDLKWWDPDGPGPRSPLVLVSGSFMAAGNLYGSSLVGYNPESRTWTHVAAPISGVVNAVLPMDDGTFFAAGSFSSPELPAASRLAFWDGSTWRDESIGIGSPVLAIARLNSGELVASTESQILRQTLAGWEPMHGSEIYGTARLLKVDGAGRLFAAGSLRLLPNEYGVLMWDGTTWTRIYDSAGDFTYPGGIGFLEILPDGCLLTGRFQDGPTYIPGGIAKWCDGVLTELPPVIVPGNLSPVMPWGKKATLQSDGSVLVEGSYEFLPRVYASLLMRLRSDSTWDSVLGSGTGAGAILSTGHDRFLYTNSSRFGLREYDNGVRRSLGDGLTAPPITSIALPDGRAFVSGEFDAVGNTPLNRIASFDGVALLPLSGGLDVACRCGLQLPDGSVVFGGNFEGFYDPTFVPSPRVARWTGARWQAMGIPGVGRVRALFLDAQQRLHAMADSSDAGVSPLQRRDGDTWTPIPVPAGFTDCRAVVDEPDGSKVFAWSGSTFMHRWDGVTWTRLSVPSVCRFLTTLVGLPNGDLVLGGPLFGSGTFASFNRRQGTWTPLGSALNGAVTSLCPIPRPDGGADVLVGGEFTIAGASTSPYIARWVPETNQWFAVGTGANAAVRSIARAPSGEILVAGDFTVFDGKAAAFMSMYRIPCPADFTCDSQVDGDDVIEFFGAWDQASAEADFDRDTLVTAADVEAFMQAWDAGC
ncbi:MAG: GC-type dockerin domain-anchored protein [Phycisphaerales bacterium]